jgi:hypothetical protein
MLALYQLMTGASDVLFDHGMNYELSLPFFDCTANVQSLTAIDQTKAQRCYDIYVNDEREPEDDAALGALKEGVKGIFPGVAGVGVSAVEGVSGSNVIRLHMKFAHVDKREMLYTYLMISHRPQNGVELLSIRVKHGGESSMDILDHRFIVNIVLNEIRSRGCP